MNKHLKIIANANEAGIVEEDYTGLPHRGKLETQSAYKIRRKKEADELKHKLSGKLSHVSKYVHPNHEANKKDPEKKHYFIDGDGEYRKPVKPNDWILEHCFEPVLLGAFISQMLEDNLELLDTKPSEWPVMDPRFLMNNLLKAKRNL